MIDTTEDDDPVPFHVVCVFETSGTTYMILDQAIMTDSSSDPAFSMVEAEQITRLIVVKEYGSERLFVSHDQGLGSAIPLSCARAAPLVAMLCPYVLLRTTLCMHMQNICGKCRQRCSQFKQHSRWWSFGEGI